jgi:hypothetical protein
MSFVAARYTLGLELEPINKLALMLARPSCS